MSDPHIEPPHPDDDELDQVAEDIARATADIPTGTILQRSPEQQAAAAALQAATMASLEAEDNQPDQARSIPALATTTGTSRIGSGHMAVMVHIPNHLAAQILDERLDAALADTITPDVMLDTLADHIHDAMPHSLGPASVDIWRNRIERTQAEDLGHIDPDKLNAWPHGDSEVRS